MRSFLDGHATFFSSADHVLERTGNAARKSDDPILRAGEETGFFGFLRAFGFRHLFHILVRLVA